MLNILLQFRILFYTRMAFYFNQLELRKAALGNLMVSSVLMRDRGDFGIKMIFSLS